MIIACVYDEIMSLRHGFDTVIGDGEQSDISEGQRQRIALARAYAKNAEVMCLDEFTSALDVATEKAVLDKLAEENRAVLMIGHRKAIIEREYDSVVVF